MKNTRVRQVVLDKWFPLSKGLFAHRHRYGSSRWQPCGLPAAPNVPLPSTCHCCACRARRRNSQYLPKSSPYAGPSAGAEVARFYGSGTSGALWRLRARHGFLPRGSRDASGGQKAGLPFRERRAGAHGRPCQTRTSDGGVCDLSPARDSLYGDFLLKQEAYREHPVLTWVA